MKAFKLREQKTFIKVLKEPPLQKPKVNWSRRVYLGIALACLFWVGKRVYNANMIIFANGQIELPKQMVNFSNDIKIIDFFIEEGSEVCQGDTLLSYKIEGDEIDQAHLSISDPSSDQWIMKEVLSLKKKISLNAVLIDNKKLSLNLIEENIVVKERLLMNGIHSEYDDLAQLLDKKQKVLTELEYLHKESQLLRNHIYRLRSKTKTSKNIRLEKLAAYQEIRYFVSPIDGIISDIFYENNEICYKKEEMMTIHQLKNASINAYFDPTEMEYLKVGDKVDIQFPDGSQREGLISKFFVSTYALPSEFQKKYEPTERNIVAEIIPLTKKEENNWKKFYKMDVMLKKKRYQIFS